MRWSPKQWLASFACTALITSCLAGCKAALPDFSQLSVLDVKQGNISEGLTSLKHTSTLSGSALHQEGVLTVGINTNLTSAPFIFSMVGDQNIKGYGVELGEALADEMGLDVRFVRVNNIDAACARVCDVVLGAAQEDVSKCDIVGHISESAPAFFYRGQQRTLDKSELSGKSCGLVAGKSSDAVLDRSDLKMKKLTFNNLNDAFEALNEGKVDFVLCDAYAGAFLASQFEGISCAGSLSAATSRGLAVLSSNKEMKTEVERALTELQSNGVERVLRGRWLGDFEGLSSASQIKGIKITEPKHDAPEVAGNASNAPEPLEGEGVYEYYDNGVYNNGAYDNAYSDYGTADVNNNAFSEANANSSVESVTNPSESSTANTENVANNSTNNSTNNFASGQTTEAPTSQDDASSTTDAQSGQ